MGNTLLPLRESLVNGIFLSLCSSLTPGVTVRDARVLETIRSATDVIADKTGTLTVDWMAYRWPLRVLSWKDEYSIGEALLFATNDSRPNPLYQKNNINNNLVDTRLASAPSLCTTAEEGAIFSSLTSHPSKRNYTNKAKDELVPCHGVAYTNEEDVYTLVQAVEPNDTSPGVLTLIHLKGKRILRILIHFKSSFLPHLVARLSVATFWSKDIIDDNLEFDFYSPTVSGSILLDAGWKRLSPPLLIVQGGGDAVARFCGSEAVKLEKKALLAAPARTFGHAVAIYPYASDCFTKLPLSPGDTSNFLDISVPKCVSEESVVQAYDFAASQNLICLSYLSKFINPVSPGVTHLCSDLASQGLRMHLCSGDTQLTLRAVAKELGVITPSTMEIVWGDTELPLLEASIRGSAAEASTIANLPRSEKALDDLATRLETRARELRELTRKINNEKIISPLSPSMSPSLTKTSSLTSLSSADEISCPFQRAIVWAATGHPIVIFVAADVLRLLHQYASLSSVRSLVSARNVSFAFFRCPARAKPLAFELIAKSLPTEKKIVRGSETDTNVLPIYIGDGPNDELVLARTPHSVAIASGSQLARLSSNVIVSGAPALSDTITLARLFHGGRQIILRDVVFVGTCIVILLSVAAHMTGFEGSTKKQSSTFVHVLDDPWSPFLMLAFTLCLHTPRMLVQALTEGLGHDWQGDPSTSLLFAVGAEVGIALLTALWVGLRLRAEVMDPNIWDHLRSSTSMNTSSASFWSFFMNKQSDQIFPNSDETSIEPLAMFAPLALASLGLITYLRQNLIISSRLIGPPRLLPPKSSGTIVAEKYQENTSQRNNCCTSWRETVVWLFTGFPGQASIFMLFLALVSHKRMSVLTCLSICIRAVIAPASLMALYRLLSWIAQTSYASILMSTDTIDRKNN
jgi:hypothetical protein